MELKVLTTLVFQVVGGLGIFLLGMKYMSEGVQAFASGKLRTLIHAVTSNRFVALTVGVLFTCMVQSSSVTTVMVVGLVNSGVMTLLQAIGVIMGANIGTTITGWILVLKIGKYGLPMLGAAAFFFLFSKNDRLRYIGMAVMGIGMVFFGLELMKDGFKPIRSIPAFVEWFALFDAGTYLGVIKCAAVGCLLTFIVQSSSATLAITMGLASSGVIAFESAAALVLGENIGTTITAYLASLGASTNAKRAAYAHVVFNVLGVTWIITLFPVYILGIKAFLGLEPGMMVLENGAETFPYMILGIATVHTGFNIINTALFIPFIGQLERLLLRIVPDRAVKEPPHLTDLQFNMIETPAVAIENSQVEIKRMASIAIKMMHNLKEATKADVVDQTHAKKIFNKEQVLDVIQNEVSIFLTNLLASHLPHHLTEEGRRQLRMADEYESISDYIEKILKLHLRLENDELSLPPEERKDIMELHDDILSFIEFVNSGFANQYREILVKAVPRSENITHKIRKCRTQHIERLSETRTPPLVTMIYTDMLNDYRRVKDHALNIAEVIGLEK